MVVRRFIGYDRYQSSEALEQLNRVYNLLGRYLNFFQSAMLLQAKSRHGARDHKAYAAARTPYQRLLEHGILSQEERQRIAEEYYRLDPVKLLLQTRQQQERLWDLATFKIQSPR